MRIHFFVRSLNLQSGGGSNYNATSYIRYLQSRGHTVVVHSFTSGNNKPPADISITEHDGQGNGFVSSQHVLCALLQKYENDADLYFLYGVDFTWGGGRYRAQGGSVPTVVYLDDYLESLGLTTEGGFLYHFKRVVWDKMFGLRLAKRVDMYMAVSPFVQDAYVQFGFTQ
jgi:glycosyltransferase involved in cell wall biosynthesis